MFQNIDLEQLDKVYAGVNSEYGEAIWLYPSSGSTENDRYVIYNYLEKIWYYGTLSRTVVGPWNSELSSGYRRWIPLQP